MKQSKNSPKGRTYVAPQVEVVSIESHGILCASAEDATSGYGRTTNMNVNTGYGW